jgi:hypothetical protein
MSLSAKLRRAPLRVVTGAFIVSSGVGKLSADEDTAKALHGMATGTYPFLGKVQPKLFVKGLAAGELAVGGALLLPIVSPVVAGAALAGFSGALLNLYWQTPGMHEEGSPKPTQQGSPIAKDIWMLGIAAGLIADGILEPAHDKKVEIGAAVSEKRAEKSRRAKRKAKRAAKKTKSANSDFAKQALETARELQADAAKRAKKAAKKTKKSAAKASDQATGRLADVRDEYGPVAVGKAKKAGQAARGLAEEYGPVAVDKAKQARDAARDLADEYGPVAVDKAKQARDAARDLAEEYGPVAADKAKQAGQAARGLAEEYAPAAVDKAKQARDAARDLAEEYGPVAADKVKQARRAAQDAGAKARDRVAG